MPRTMPVMEPASRPPPEDSDMASTRCCLELPEGPAELTLEPRGDAADRWLCGGSGVAVPAGPMSPVVQAGVVGATDAGVVATRRGTPTPGCTAVLRSALVGGAAGPLGSRLSLALAAGTVTSPAAKKRNAEEGLSDVQDGTRRQPSRRDGGPAYPSIGA